MDGQHLWAVLGVACGEGRLAAAVLTCPPHPQPLPSCLRFVQTNISHLLQDTSAQLLALKPWITRRNFSRCLELQCQPGKGP